MKIIDIAKVCHQANKAICELNGDNSQLEWDDAPKWQRESAVQGVIYKIENPKATPEDQHKAWSESKIADGWVYGPIKDADKKEHHCLVPYQDLPINQQAKDHLFAGIVLSLIPFLETGA